MLTQALILFLVLDAVMLAALLLRPRLIGGPGGRLVAFLAFFLLPGAALALGTQLHLEQSKSTEFCLSCHEMEPYGQSLLVDSPDHLPAQHFQNKRIDQEHACFTCHTNYTMYGDVQAKINGLKHLWVHYVGTVPEQIELYKPYQNRECLHCHGGARSFEENDFHVDMLEDLRSEEISCLECHDLGHEVGDLAEMEMWRDELPEEEL
jgi:cytochrome c-type protein NapC